ncbi:MAG TPA: TIM barrel protein [Thermomicrobiales bacterium]|nr:TIM barrel protein [Thermomicrobiales bacterium]
MTDPVRLAVVRCGGMGRRNLAGLAQLTRCDACAVDLVAVCDLDERNAADLADEARMLLGSQPQVFTDLATMVRETEALEAAACTTDSGSHHLVASELLDCGMHTLCEKPLALTIRGCNRIIAAAQRSGTVIPGWATDAAGLDRSERRRIHALYDDHRLELCGLSGNTPLLVEDPAVHAEHMLRLRGYLDLAADLHCPGERLTVSTTSGGDPDDWDQVKGMLVERFGELVQHALHAGVLIGMEPHVGAALHRPDQALWLREQVDSPGLTIHFDISHFNVQEMAMEPVIAQLAPHSAHTQVKDERGVAPNHQFLIPGEGEMDYVRYLMAMRQAGYDGHIVVEISRMVQRRPDYDALAVASQSYQVLARAFAKSGIARAQADAASRSSFGRSR